MENKKSISKIFHRTIKTQHVFMEDEQVFLKKEKPETYAADANFVEWFPTSFKWKSKTTEQHHYSS